MYSFAEIEFPSFMLGLRKFQRVEGKSVVTRMTDDVNMTTGGSQDPTVFDYVSEKSYVKMKISGAGFHLMIMHIGQTVVNDTFTDFAEVRDAVLRYS